MGGVDIEAGEGEVLAEERIVGPGSIGQVAAGVVPEEGEDEVAEGEVLGGRCGGPTWDRTRDLSLIRTAL